MAHMDYLAAEATDGIHNLITASARRSSPLPMPASFASPSRPARRGPLTREAVLRPDDLDRDNCFQLVASVSADGRRYTRRAAVKPPIR
jgi:hypothetical protein